LSFLTTSLPGYDNPNQDVFNDKSIEIKKPATLTKLPKGLTLLERAL